MCSVRINSTCILVKMHSRCTSTDADLSVLVSKFSSHAISTPERSTWGKETHTNETVQIPLRWVMEQKQSHKQHSLAGTNTDQQASRTSSRLHPMPYLNLPTVLVASRSAKCSRPTKPWIQKAPKPHPPTHHLPSNSHGLKTHTMGRS